MLCPNQHIVDIWNQTVILNIRTNFFSLNNNDIAAYTLFYSAIIIFLTFFKTYSTIKIPSGYNKGYNNNYLKYNTN